MSCTPLFVNYLIATFTFIHTWDMEQVHSHYHGQLLQLLIASTEGCSLSCVWGRRHWGWWRWWWAHSEWPHLRWEWLFPGRFDSWLRLGSWLRCGSSVTHEGRIASVC